MKMNMFRFQRFPKGFEQRRVQGSMVNGIVDILLVLEGVLHHEDEHVRSQWFT